VTQTQAGPHAPEGTVRPAGWWFDALLLAAFGLITLLLAVRIGLGIDLAVRNWVDGHRPSAAYWIARVGNLLGQGGFFTALSAILALFLVWRRHSVRPILPVVVAFVLTFGILTPLKDWTDRAAPHAGSVEHVLHPERLGSGGVSYPSGHLTNAFVWYGVLALLLSAWLPLVWRRVILIAPPVILAVTTVYLGYHWLSDTIAGILLGLFLARLMYRIRWDAIPLGSGLTRSGWAGPAWDPATTASARHASPGAP
jgi:membrane-associated phospholipid phosphatase